MENISIDTLYDLLDKFDTLKELLTRYGTAILIAAAVFALLNCFFGYALRKVWSVLLGFGIGASGGMLLATYTDQSDNMILGVTLGLGFIFGLLALLLYRIGTFFLIVAFLGFSLYKLLNPSDLIVLLFLLGIAIVVALIGVPFERITVILITSVCGALTSVTLAYDFQAQEYDLVMWIIVLILAALGMVFQFKPWKDRGYWEDAEDREEDYRRKKKNRRRADSASRSVPVRSSGKRRKKKKSRGSSGSEPSSRRTKVSQNTMYDFHFVPEEPDDVDEKKPPKRHSNHRQTKSSDFTQPSPDAQRSASQGTGGTRQPASQVGGDTRPIPDPASGSIEPDLSEIRQHISEEIQEIYRDTQEQNHK